MFDGTHLVVQYGFAWRDIAHFQEFGRGFAG